MVDDPLFFVVSTVNLDAAIAGLANLFPETLYPIAWRILTKERERRDLKEPAMPILMTRPIYDELPPPIKPLLGTADAGPRFT